MGRKFIDRINEQKTMNCGKIATIIKYNGADDITVEFKDTNEIFQTTYANFQKGKIKSKFAKSVLEIGVIGTVKINDEYGKQFKSYKQWVDMLHRWYDENYYEIDNQVMCLDKDILHKGNKLYSPENCVFAPNEINLLFIKRQNKRGEYPIGVTFNKRERKYRSQCSYGNGKSKYLGDFNTIEKAFEIYRIEKENYIKRVANLYKNKIPQKLYYAMMNYIVEKTD